MHSLPRVRYAPVVFTIPKMLRPYFRFDRALFGELCRVAYAVVRDHLRERFSHLPGAVPAMMASTQSFGSLLVWHPHLHALISVGIFDTDGAFHSDPDLDFGALEEDFRQAFLLRLLRRGTIDTDRYHLLRAWKHSGFSVFSDRFIGAGNVPALESAIQYMERSPVSLQRLTLLDTGFVIYEGNFHPSLGTNNRSLTPLEFLALIVPHVHHRYECRLHFYGATSTTHRRRWGRIGSHPGPPPTLSHEREEAAAFLAQRKRNWAHLISKVWHDDCCVA